MTENDTLKEELEGAKDLSKVRSLSEEEKQKISSLDSRAHELNERHLAQSYCQGIIEDWWECHAQDEKLKLPFTADDVNFSIHCRICNKPFKPVFRLIIYPRVYDEADYRAYDDKYLLSNDLLAGSKFEVYVECEVPSICEACTNKMQIDARPIEISRYLSYKTEKEKY